MKKLIVTMSFSAVLFCSCSHYYYVANVQNVPLFKEKNEFRLSGFYGSGDESISGEAQAAYSITDHIGIMADFMAAKGGDVSSQNYGKGKYFEGAIGYFRPAGDNGVFEIYGGLGGSNQHHEYASAYDNGYYGSSDLSFLKFFVQPSFGLTFNMFDIAFSTRFCSMSFDIKDNRIFGNEYEYSDLYAVATKNHFNLEPALTLRGGWKNIKVQFQAEYAGLLNSEDLYFGEEWHLSIGLNIAIAKRYK